MIQERTKAMLVSTLLAGSFAAAASGFYMSAELNRIGLALCKGQAKDIPSVERLQFWYTIRGATTCRLALKGANGETRLLVWDPVGSVGTDPKYSAAMEPTK